MKRIIAAALSILVGAFGYTIVDSAIEDRVATLESEVVELREEVLRYHPKYISTTTQKKTTTKNNSTTTIIYFPSTSTTDSYWQPTAIGSFLNERPNSMHKFFLRKWSNGKIYYVSPGEYGNQSVSNEAEMSRLLNSEKRTTKYRASITDPMDVRTETTVINIGITDPTDDGRLHPTTTDVVVTIAPGYTVIDQEPTTALTYEEQFLYVTESTAQLTDISEKISYSYYYDKDYSKNSTEFTKEITTINVKCKGYTDPSFAGKQIVFSVSWMGNSRPDSVISNTIKADGSFEYEAVYSSASRMYNYDAYYYFSSISVN